MENCMEIREKKKGNTRVRGGVKKGEEREALK